MEANKTFEELWEKKVAPIIKEYEPARRRHRTAFIRGVVVATAIVLPAFLLVLFMLSRYASRVGEGEFPDLFAFTLIAALALHGAIVSKYYNSSAEYLAEYKKRIIDEVLRSTRFGWTFVPKQTGSMSERRWKEVYRKSELSPERLQTISTDDEFVGRYQNMPLTMVELMHTKKEGKAQVTEFGGLFIVGEHERELQGVTSLRIKRSFGWGSTVLTRPVLKPRNRSATELEWNDFNDFFSVRSTHQREAREILTPDFMRTIYEWSKEHEKRDVRIVLKGNALYIGVPAFGMFEPLMFGKEDRYKERLRLEFETIELVEELVTLIAEQERLRRRGE